MRVLLLTDVRGVGRRGEIKEVAEGYGRNFLIARKLAKPASEGTLASHQSQQAQKQASASARQEKAAQAAELLKGKEIKFYLRADAKGSVFGSVKADEVIRAIKDEVGIEPDAVQSKDLPFKTIGDHEVVVSWKPAIQVTITARVLPQ